MKQKRSKRRRLSDLTLVAFNLDRNSATICDQNDVFFEGTIVGWYDDDDEETDDKDDCAVIVCLVVIDGREYMPAYDIIDMPTTVH